MVKDIATAAIFFLIAVFLVAFAIALKAFGIALAEAAQAGKAMISCDIKTGTSFINRHQETGLVVKPACAESLREAMCFMWHYPAQVKRWGAAAKAHAAAVLSLSAMTSAYLDLTHRVLGESG